MRKLQEQLNLNSSNSSIPPSANPLNAPKPVNKRATGRKPGGQTGHPGHFRRRLPPERINAVVTYVPTVCSHCQADLPANAQPHDPGPAWHQVADLPELAAQITEHRPTSQPLARAADDLNRARFPQKSAPTPSGHAWLP